ncbi:MAG: protein-glutamate O-methyltransferase CheR [Candidatus Eremiobacteraeota bacterium]|nr:protein-glutamate O-methyltransferase CheR [Candidatus Eremiobacteraeota bacterium]
MPEFSSSELVYLRAILKNLSGLALGEEKDYLFQTRLDEVCRSHGVSSSGLVSALANGKRTIEESFVDAMTTQETFFYRDLGLFDTLQTIIFPRLIERRKDTRRLRIWSAGCANGQEPYSLAMLLRTHFDVLQDWNITIVATDISKRAIAKARTGLYSQSEVNRGLPVRKLLRYFRQEEQDWKVVPEIGSLVEFRTESLLTPSFAADFDLILCRNVLIYFDIPTKRKILGNLYTRLKKDGFLVLGGPERIFNVTNIFKPTTVGSVVYYSPRAESEAS